MSQAQYAGTGRRKNAVARVRLVPGTGKITVNKKDVEEYIPHADLRLVINQPFAVTSTAGSYDVFVNSCRWWIRWSSRSYPSGIRSVPFFK